VAAGLEDVEGTFLTGTFYIKFLNMGIPSTKKADLALLDQHLKLLKGSSRQASSTPFHQRWPGGMGSASESFSCRTNEPEGKEWPSPPEKDEKH